MKTTKQRTTTNIMKKEETRRWRIDFEWTVN